VARVKGSEGATVITFFQHKGIPAVATGYGCGGCAHTADEYVRIENLYKGALMLEDFLKNYSFNRN
jgi:acetylornithine deacetylase/succinyl-diaminopimelate desuccinylase-like protein